MLELRRLLRRTSSPEFIREPTAAEEGKLGIALSGGGIRSASYCLGALQALAMERLQPEQEPILARAAELTAVSGGAYIASAHAVSATQVTPPQPRPTGRGSF